MRFPKKLLRKKGSYYLLLSLLCLLLLGSVTGPMLLEKARKQALKETIRAYFNSSKPEEKDQAWLDLVSVGSEDFEFLLWGLENTNSLFMFPRGKLKELIDQIEEVNGGPGQIISACSAALAGELTVGKCLAMDILSERSDLIGPSEVEMLREILMNTGEKWFVRRKAAETLSKLKIQEAADDFVAILTTPASVSTQVAEEASSEPEPLALREVCLSLLCDLSPEEGSERIKAILSDKEAELRLFKRAVECAVRMKESAILSEVLQGEEDSERRKAILKGLIRIGDQSSKEVVRGFLSGSVGDEEIASVLEAVAGKGAEGFEDIVEEGLRSQNKAIRLRAIRAALRLTRGGSYPELESALSELSQGATPEERYLLEHSGR